MYKLWSTVERAEGVFTARRAREAVSETRFRGYTSRSQDEFGPDEEDTDRRGWFLFRSTINNLVECPDFRMPLKPCRNRYGLARFRFHPSEMSHS